MQELRHSSGSSSSDDGSRTQEDVSDLGLFQQQDDDVGGGGSGGGGGATAVKVYSAQEMKQRYYEAFWRAR